MTLPSILAQPMALPVVAAPLFIASNPQLVIAQCRAGVIGSFPALNARPASMLGDWLDEIGETLAAATRVGTSPRPAPFAVNQIVHRSNDRLDHDMGLIAERRIPIVITSLGAREDVNAAVHAYGGIVLHDVVSDAHARKAIDKGADGIIAVAAGAGGHAGAQSPFALVTEIRRWHRGPLLLSGAISHGRSILAALAAGADFAYIGSAFLATAEASIDEEYKQMVVQSSAADIVNSSLFTGVHGNYLRGSIARAGLDADQLPSADPSSMSFATQSASPRKAWRDIWGAGQGIATSSSVESAAQVVQRLSREFDTARRDLESSAWSTNHARP